MKYIETKYNKKEPSLDVSNKNFPVGSAYLKDNRPQSIIQKKPVEEKPVQKKFNRTGLPDTLKSGIESLSGLSMDDVKVHYNSDKPAQLSAHAYAKGTDIHLASGQEKHLPHEAWHIVQQKQGRVKPTTKMKGKADINDDKDLEKEADVMGNKAFQLKYTQSVKSLNPCKSLDNRVTQRIIQCVKKIIGQNLFIKFNPHKLNAFKDWLRKEKNFNIKDVETGIEVTSADVIVPAMLIGEFNEFYAQTHVTVKPIIAHVGQGLFAVANRLGAIQGLQTSGAATCVAVAFSDTRNGVFAVGHIDPEAMVHNTVFRIYDEMVDVLMKMGVESFADANVEIANNTKVVIATSGQGNQIVRQVEDAIKRVFRGQVDISGSHAIHATAAGVSEGELHTHADFIKVYRHYEKNLSVIPKHMLEDMLANCEQLIRTSIPQAGDREYAIISMKELRDAKEKLTDALTK